ncbi:hypothetical protein HID58_075472, partial [Brassica napus]
LKEISKRGQPWQLPICCYHKHVCSRVPGVLFMLMDSYVDLEYKKYRVICLHHLLLTIRVGEILCHIDHQYLEMQYIISTNFYKGSMIFTTNLSQLHLDLCLKTSTSFHPLTPTPDTRYCRAKKELCPSS